MDKGTILKVVGAMALAVMLVLIWKYTGASDSIAFRRDMIEQEGIKYQGISWISQSELGEVNTYLGTYPDSYQWDIKDIDGDLVEVKYYFLSLDNNFTFLDSKPISSSFKASNALSEVLLPLIVISGVMTVIVGFSRPSKADEEDDVQVS